MVRIKVLRLSQILYTGLVVVLAALAVVLVLRVVPASSPSPRPQTTTPPATYAPRGTPASVTTPKPAGVTVPTRSELAPASAPAAAQAPTPSPAPVALAEAPTAAPLFLTDTVSKPPRTGLSVFSRLLFGVDLSDPSSLPSAMLPYGRAVSVMAPVAEERQTESEHEDAVPEEIHIELAQMDKTYTPPVRVASVLRALIYHTHTEEAYEQVSADPYKEAGKWRTEDYAHSIVRVGDELSRQLSLRGFDVLHDKTDHEPPKLGTAYVRSLETLEGYEARGEQFDLYIDLHRDAYSKNWDEPSPTVAIDGKECARVMMLIGNGEGFTVKPEWHENYKLAQRLSDELNQIAPGFARPVMVKDGRYNQHVSRQAILIEVGHNKSTLEQCLNSMPYLADALAKTLE